MLALTPPMGWNTWNTFGEDINEDMILSMADVMVEKGYLAKGYNYLVIDDCWALHERDSEGRLQSDPAKFPHGMKWLGDRIHEKGLKFGMYSCSGTLTCAGYPSSYEHEFEDAATFASWGVDFLKYDYCFRSPIVPGKYLFRKMGTALANCGRDILFSACSWGMDETAQWIKETSAQMWRSTGDIQDNWEKVKALTYAQDDLLPYAGVGCFNDMDMLIVGMYNKGNASLGGCTDEQYKAHFSIWALLGSPLMMGGDLRDMSESCYQIMTNEEMIAINQDPGMRQVFKVGRQGPWGKDTRIYCRLLSNGDYAIGMFNMGERKARMSLNLDELGLGMSTGKTLQLHEVWTKEDSTVTNGTILKFLEPSECVVYRGKVVDLKY